MKLLPKTNNEPTLTPVTTPNLRWLRGWFIGLTSVLLVFLAAVTSYAFYYQDRIVPRTTIAGIGVGGLTQAQAQSLLSTRETAFLQAPLGFTYQVKTWQVVPATFGLTFENEQAVAAAYRTGRNGSFIQQIGTLATSLIVPHDFTLSTTPLTNENISKLPAPILKDVQAPFTETGLNFKLDGVTVAPGRNGKRLDSSKLGHDLAAAFSTGSGAVGIETIITSPQITANQAEPARAQANLLLAAPWAIQLGSQTVILLPIEILPWLSTKVQDSSLSLIVSQDKVAAYVASLSTRVQKPIDATLTVTDGAVSIVQDGRDGLSLQTDQTSAAISAALLAENPGGRAVTAITEVAHPDVWSGNLASLGITQRIGTGSTDYSGSPANRVANITTGEKSISGQFIKAGAEFSTIATLGPIDEAHGYVQGLVIVNNKTLPADGGGLCQVSTTLFRAVLNAGLPITDRTAHAYEVGYYQRGIGPGLDATIYDPNPDFKWKNDTGHDVFVQGTIKGTVLTFDIYGTADGRTAVIDGPHTLQTFQPSGGPIYVTTDTLPKGTTEAIDPPVPGAKTTATYTVTRGGQVVNKQTFNSFYQAMPAQYLVGTK
jgi:vancomycin resistance protein YoaR